jgi:UDP:flavonoid glycosyltransferase YjiC (YdhE family)
MKVVLATYGSRGDMQPMIALAQALQAAGHDAPLAAPPENEHWVRESGCQFHPLGRDFKAFMDTLGSPHTVKAVLAMAEFVRQGLRDQMEQLPDLAHDADVVLGCGLIFATRTVADRFNLPFNFIAVCPQIMPSDEYPSPLVKNHSLPVWVKRLSWWATTKIDLFRMTRIVNAERTKHGLAPVKDLYRHFIGGGVLVATDPPLGQVPSDVKQPYCQTGYLHMKQTGELDPALNDFLESGPPPVYVGFGSMSSDYPIKDTGIIVEAARRAGVRVVLSRGWAKLGGVDLGDDFFVVDTVPHQLLFPRIAAAVHHGGSGTTATAARLGVPQVVVPHAIDQYYWGRQVLRHRLGPKPVWRGKMSVNRLTAAIRQAVSDQHIHAHAREMAKLLQPVDGPANAVKYIESLVNGRS